MDEDDFDAQPEPGHSTCPTELTLTEDPAPSTEKTSEEYPVSSSMLELLQTHHTSTIPVHRYTDLLSCVSLILSLALARKLPQLLEQLSETEILEAVPNILRTMSKDSESGIRQALCEQFKEVGRIFKVFSEAKELKLTHF